MCFATLWGEIRDFGALYLLKKVIMEVTPGVPRAIFMLIMPTIRRRYRARELRRLARARKAAIKAAKSTQSSRCASQQDNATQPKPAQQAPNRQPKPQQSQAKPAVKKQSAPAVTQQAAQPKPAPCEQPQITASPSPTTTESSPGKSTLEKLLRHKHSRRNRKKHRRH